MPSWMRAPMLVAIVTILIAGTAWAQATGPESRAWIDQPLGWIPIMAVPVAITAHVDHPSGVDEARLDVNGGTIAQQEAGGETLETVQFTWVPPGSGTYLLEVYGSSQGEWGEPGSVVVTVIHDDVDGPTTTTTPSPTSTSTSTTSVPRTTTTTSTSTSTTSTSMTTTSTTTTTTTLCLLGVPSPAGVSGVNTYSPTVFWSYAGCREPEEFEIQISRTADFFRDEYRGGAPGDARAAGISVGANCTWYYWRIRTYDLGSYGSWSGASSFFVQTGRTCP